jgi:serine/threonine-protein kinase
MALAVGGVMLGGLVAAVLVANRPPERRRATVETKAAEAPLERAQRLPAEPPPPAPAPPPVVEPPSPTVAAPPAKKEEWNSATFPVDSIRLEARRDVFRVSTAFTALTDLEPGARYTLNELGAPRDRPPLFFLLVGQGVSADDAVGTVPGPSEPGVVVTGARAVMFFTVGPQEEGGPPKRFVQVENVTTHAKATVTAHTSQVAASLSKAFELKGLDGLTTYQLTLESVWEGARTRGTNGGAARKVACARQSSDKVWYAGDDSDAFFREQQFLLVEGEPMDVRGASAVRCGFIDDDPADNQGELAVRIVSEGRTRGMERVNPEIRGGGDEAKRLYEEGLTFTRMRKFDEAELRLLSCLDVEPSYAPCYLALGALKARTNQLEEGATYYRIFLRLAPDDPRAPTVRRFLLQYDSNYGRE